MLLLDAGLAWLHFIFAFILVGAICAELFILRLDIGEKVARLLLRVDLFYGGSAAGIILVGVLRVIFGAKGWEYYLAQPFFWVKMGLFAVIGVLSIIPTRFFRRWVKYYNQEWTFTPPEDEVRRVRHYVNLQVHLIAVLLVCASLMARGILQLG